MTNPTFYDVIIVGGGPAGLSVGSELSKALNVLVLEKDVVGKTTKSWFDPKDVVLKNPDIIPYTYGGVRRFLTNTCTGTPFHWDARLFDRYPYVKEREILLYWKNIILTNGSTILEECPYEDHVVQKDRVIVETTRGRFESKLLIDASGADSIVLEKYEIENKNYYWWSVYGAVGKHPGGVRNMEVGDYMLWQTFADSMADEQASLRHGRPVFEYEILDENTSFSLILYLRRERMPLEYMREAYDHIIRKEDSTANFHDIEIQEYKSGWYPSGGLTQRVARNRVDFIGDAGCWTTPCGWGMGFILNNYRQYAGSLVELVQKDRLDEESLYTLVDMQVYDKTQIALNQLITHFLSNASARELDKFIGLFREIDPLICEKIFTLKVNMEELRTVMRVVRKNFSLEELARIIPREDYKYLIPLAGYSFVNFLHNLFYRLTHFGKAPTRGLGDGFDLEG